jgi:sialidase-1
MLRLSILFFVASFLAPLTTKPRDWHGFPIREFSIHGHAGYVAIPPGPAPGCPWLWRARFPEYHPEAAIALLQKGFYVAYLDVPNIFGSPEAVDDFNRFYREARRTLHLAQRPALEAVSRGGLFAYNWAIRNPNKVSCVYAESPVCDIKSWPGGRAKGLGSPKDWQQAQAAYHFSEDQLVAWNGNPIDYAAKLARHHIPALHVVCSEDQVVPPMENTEIFAKRYRDAGGSIEVYYNKTRPTTDHGHHFDLDDVQREVDFVLHNALGKR